MPTLGIRNNNPGNLKPNGFTYLGQVDTDSKGHAIFSNLVYGLRALAMDLTLKINRGVNTIQDIAEVYAPASDGNDPNEWAANVSDYSDLNRYNTLNTLTTTLQHLMRGVVVAENGADGNTYVSDADITAGIEFYKTGKEPQTGTGNNTIWILLLLVGIGYGAYKFSK